MAVLHFLQFYFKYLFMNLNSDALLIDRKEVTVAKKAMVLLRYLESPRKVGEEKFGFMHQKKIFYYLRQLLRHMMDIFPC